LYQGDIEYINFPSGTPRYWSLSVSAITVNGKGVTTSTGNAALAAIDTGTTLIGGPSADVQAIWAAVPGSVPMTGQNAGFYSFPCTTTVTVTMSFGGNAWPINPNDMNLGQLSQGSTMCQGAIFDLSQGSNVSGGSGSGNPSWVVGDTFLKNVYTVFRSSPGSVGFAELSSAAGGSSGTPATATVQQTVSATGSGSKPTTSGSPPSFGAAHSLSAGSFGLISASLSVAVVAAFWLM
jgi:cathepsin D